MIRSLAGWLGLLVVVAAIGPMAVGPAAADDVTLTVTVENRTGSGVSGAELTASWDGGSATETTRSNGQALIDVPEGADVTIEVDHETYVRNQPYEVENARIQDVDIRVAERGQATITVQGGNGPVEGASVRFIRSGKNAVTVTTDDRGVARTGPIEQDTYDVAVSKPGYFEERVTVGVGEDTSRVVGIDRGTARTSITVEDDHFEPPEPVADATVEIQPLGSTLVTLSEGEATTGLPINRDYEVTVSKPGYEDTTRTLSIGESQSASLTVPLNRNPELNLSASSRRIVVGERVHVTLTDEYDDPVADVALTVDGTEQARTDDDGEADVPIGSAGNVTIAATHEGAEANVTVEGVQADGSQVTTANGTATETEGGIGPGFGSLIALLGVALAAAFLARRH